MNKDLQDRISLVRTALAADPANILAGSLGDENPEEIYDDIPAGYRQFLKECDGARVGSIDLWSSKELPSKQYVLVDCEGGERNWVAVGQILTDTICLRREDSSIFLFRRFDEVNPEGLASLDDFLLDHVFGEKYSTMVPGGEMDDWWTFYLANIRPNRTAS